MNMKDFGFYRGVNLGGWFSQCDYSKERLDHFIEEKDMDVIAGWGLDHVRLPMDYNVLETAEGELSGEGFDRIARAVEWCLKRGLKVVLDLHKTAGYSFDAAHQESGFFGSRTYQDRFYRLWEGLAARFNDPENIAFELLNEVTSKEFADPWNRIATRTIKAIRAKDKDIRIVVGGIFNDSIYGLTLLDVPVDENTVFTFHCYSPLVFTHQGAHWVKSMPLDPESYRFRYPDTYRAYRERSAELFGADFSGEFAEGADDGLLDGRYFERMIKTAVDIAEADNVPLYCGEYGVIDLAEPADLIRWYKDMNSALVKYNIARSAWSYREMNFGLEGEWLNGVRDELLKYL